MKEPEIDGIIQNADMHAFANQQVNQGTQAEAARYYLEEQERTIAEAQLEVESILMEVYHLLRQDTLKPKEDGTFEWVPTSDPTKDNLDIFPLTCWNVSVDTFGYRAGYAVVAITRDTNGSAGFLVWGWHGRDTFWASAWAAFWIGYVQNAGKSWLLDGTVALILKIDYDSNGEPSKFTVVEALGTVTELDLKGYLVGNKMLDTDGTIKDSVYTIPNPPWWFDKVCKTAVTATIHYDP